MAKSNRKERWRNISINPSNIDAYMQDLIDDTKAQYITQGVSFNKADSFQMGLLRRAILDHSSFSGLVKHLLTQHFTGQQQIAHVAMQQGIQQVEYQIPAREQLAVSSEQVVPSRVSAPTSQPTVPSQSDNVPHTSPSSKRRRTGGGGAFLKANPNALPPKDSPANQ